MHAAGDRNCNPQCAMMHQAAVPKGYTLVSVEANMNYGLMDRYLYIRNTMGPQKEQPVETSKPAAKLLAADPSWARLPKHNEWHVFHGTSRKFAESICRENFQLDRIGSGAAGGVMGNSRHRPLYGFGYYFAERSTKADEYATKEQGSKNLTMLVCRVAGGKAFVCQEDGMSD